jgi:hypothetical protein
MNTQRIHIIGPPRSGTTLMHTLFSVCMGVDGVTSREERIWRRMPHGERVLVTKCPGEERFAPPLLKFDRDLWFIFMLRDPRDLLVSEHGSEPGRYWSNLRTWYEALAVYEAMKDHPRFITVRYEDLVRTPDEVQQDLLRRLPFLRNAVPFSQYQEHIPQGVRQSTQIVQAMRGIRAVSAENVGAWQQHLPRVKAHISRYPDLPARLISLGYEQDTAWVKALESVPADNQPSVVPDNLPLLKRCRYALRFYGHLLVYLMRRYAWAGHRQA